MWRMGYQTARLGAQYAQWYKVTGDPEYRDRAYRCFSYNTYMMQESGQSSDGPTKDVGFWWSDCYGEAPRMYYYGMAAVPEWAPPDENHLLHATSIVKAISYTESGIDYTTIDKSGTELFRLCKVPAGVSAEGKPLPGLKSLKKAGWTYDSASGVLRVRHDRSNRIRVQFAAEK